MEQRDEDLLRNTESVRGRGLLLCDFCREMAGRRTTKERQSLGGEEVNMGNSLIPFFSFTAF